MLYETGPVRRPGMKGVKSMNWKMIVVFVLVVLFVVITVQNTEVVSFTLLFWQLTMSRIVWLLLTFVVGVAAGYILCTIRCRSLNSSGEEL
jgi:uncharacterized integral membrane protein